jgi:hypothetical protein
MGDLTGTLKTFINKISPVEEFLLSVYLTGITIVFCLLVFFISKAINEKPFYILFAIIIVGLVGYTIYSLCVILFDGRSDPIFPYLAQIIPELLLLFMLYNSFKKLGSNNNYRRNTNMNNNS